MKTIVIEDSLLQRFSNIVQNKIIESIIFKKNAERDSNYKFLTKTDDFKGKKLSVTGDKVLNAWIEKHKGKAILIDFWATWCAPCLDQMRASKPFKDKYKDIIYIYACALSPEGRWRFTVQDINVEGEHYYLSDEQFNYLAKLFNFNIIPHYIAIDRNGKIVSAHAPGPAKEEEFPKLLGNLSIRK